jgi:hypothetical protein
MGESAGTIRGWSVIRLRRRQGFYRDRLRAYRVRIDGNLAGKIAEGETKDFFVPPGEHRVRLAIDGLWGSREVAIQVREGELAEFICRPGGPALQSLFALLVPHRYIRLNGPAATNRT